MTIGQVAALICIALAFVVGVIEEKVLFGVTDWLIASIAFSLFGGPVVIKRGGSS